MKILVFFCAYFSLAIGMRKETDMKIFLTRKEKQEVKLLKRVEKLHTRRMTQEELNKIEYAERLRDSWLNLYPSIVALFVSLLAFGLAIASRL